MADSKVSELTSATSVGVADQLYVVQSSTKPVTHLAADASGGSIAIPAGTVNQIKYITMISTSGGSFAISANIANSLTVTFSAVGKTAQLLYTNSKWHMVGGTATIA